MFFEEDSKKVREIEFEGEPSEKIQTNIFNTEEVSVKIKLVFGFLVIIMGFILAILGLNSLSDIKMTFGKLSVEINNAIPGVCFCLMGCMIIIFSSPKIKIKKK